VTSLRPSEPFWIFRWYGIACKEQVPPGTARQVLLKFKSLKNRDKVYEKNKIMELGAIQV